MVDKEKVARRTRNPHPEGPDEIQEKVEVVAPDEIQEKVEVVTPDASPESPDPPKENAIQRRQRQVAELIDERLALEAKERKAQEDRARRPAEKRTVIFEPDLSGRYRRDELEAMNDESLLNLSRRRGKHLEIIGEEESKERHTRLVVANLELQKVWFASGESGLGVDSY